MCCQHRRAFSFEMVTSEPKTTCNRPKFNAYVLRFCFCSVVRHLKICTQIVLKPSRLIFFLLLLLSFLFVFFVMLSYVFFWLVSSPRVSRVCVCAILCLSLSSNFFFAFRYMCPVFYSSSSSVFLLRPVSFLLLIILLCTALFVMCVF